MKKICFISSSGGHFEQLMMLKPLIEKYDGFVVTEKTQYMTNDKDIKYFLSQVNRKEKVWILKMIKNFYLSFKIFLKEKPDFIISTGVLATIPICVIAKIFGKKVIYIESFAKIHDSTLTGRLLYKFADKFYVQWEDLLQIYPKATFKGGIY